MSVSINMSLTGQIRQSLSNSLSEASRSGIAMATGNAILHAYQDPTGLAIGSSMKSEYNVLSIITTGMEQSQSMLYIAEAGIKDAYKVVTEMYEILARAKLGYMTDDLIEDTLSKTYQQYKDELDRIADSVDFNGQKLLNGTGGTVDLGVKATVGLANYDYDKVALALGTYTLTPGSGTVNGVNEPSLKFIANNMTITGGTLVRGATGGTGGAGATTNTLKNAQIEIDVQVTGTASGATGTTTIKIQDVDISFTSTSGDLSAATAPKIIIPATSVIQTSPVKGTGSTPINSLTGVKLGTGADAVKATTVTASNVVTTYPISGGRQSSSSFKFVTGTNFNQDLIQTSFPNIKLGTSKGITGMVESLNIQDSNSNIVPKNLTNLKNSQDADTDAPIVRALMAKFITCLDDVGASQARFINIVNQLQTSCEELDSAQGAILNSDLAKEAENFARASTEVTIAISTLQRQISLLEDLTRIVS